MPPKISVIMPVYNGEKYLNQAIESILQQSYGDFEFLIIDDASTDESVSIINNYQDPRIKFLCNEHNLGIARSLNRGLLLAEGEYIARMDSDDVSLPQRFIKQVSYLDLHPHVTVLGTAARLITDLNEKGQEIKFPLDHLNICWKLCFFENPIIHPTVMMRKNMVNSIGGYHPDKVPAEDYELWCRISKKSQLANLPSPYLYLRKHEGSISFQSWLKQQQCSLENSKWILSEFLKSEIPTNQLEAACHVVWTPNNSTQTDYYQLAHLKNELINVFISDNDLPLIEKIDIARVARKEIKNLEDYIPKNPIQKEVQSWIENLDKFISDSKNQLNTQKEEEDISIISFQCINHFLPLIKEKENYICPEGCSFPIINHVPRFFPGDQDHRIKRDQLKDIRNFKPATDCGSQFFRNRLEQIVDGDLIAFEGKKVLELVCGEGIITEALLKAGAKVVATDASELVELNYKNCHFRGNHEIIQTNLIDIPVSQNQFDFVICLGVIPIDIDQKKMIISICDNVKSGGTLFLDSHIVENNSAFSIKFLRSFLKDKSPVFSFWFCQALVSILWPIHRLLWKFKGIFIINKLRLELVKKSPMIDYHDAYFLLGSERLYEWAILDTYANLADNDKNPLSLDRISDLLNNAGMIDIKTNQRDGLITVCAHKPILN